MWKIPGWLAKTTELFIRSMSVVALPITIVSAIWKPMLWSWSIAAGAVVVVLANWLMLVLAQRIYRAGAENHLSIAPPDARLNARGSEQWWWTMLLYAVVLAVIALGLQLRWMRDTTAFVFGLTVISIGIHCLSKITLSRPLTWCLARGRGAVRLGIRLRTRLTVGHFQYSCHCDSPT